MSLIPGQTYYEILEISPAASQEDVHRAFQRAKNTYAPNSAALYTVFSREEAEQLLRLIDEAYSVLSNISKRKDYDDRLKTPEEKTPKPIVTIKKPEVKAEPKVEGLDTSGGLLPDFDIPEIGGTWPAEESAVKLRSDENKSPAQGVEQARTLKAVGKPVEAKSVLPTVGKSGISHYEVDSQLEKEIEEQLVFDGTFIQKIRQYKRISLDQISELTRIGRHYLIALESNDFANLPATVFVRGFVVQIAKVLGLNSKKVADSYIKLLKDSRED